MYSAASRSVRQTTAHLFARCWVRTPGRGVATLPLFSLEGKTCVVTGAGRGLGKETLTAFARSGARGACIDLTLASCNSSISHIKSHLRTTASDLPEPDIRPYACDVTNESAVQSTFAQIAHDFGGIDILVTAAGIVDNVEAERYEFERWKKMVDVNLHGSWLAAREGGKYMIRQNERDGEIGKEEGWKKRGGSIVFIGSMSGNICVRPQKQAGYNATKAAVNMLAKSLATEWATHNIRVNSLSPGYIATDLIKGLLKKEGKDLSQEWVKHIPMGRMAHPSEFQGTVVWMVSDAASYLTGSDIIVDGGYTAY
ncbi:short chain dehydrogenase [Aspergillus sclerotialis]|uniref:Short chain dehydrogenase n=1 Tax=Aspergillus sclerotialis TaxID=2070753 RepID=A0A3A2ZKF9_9EURO|nr:short chain dehydrogenase [Aspergillus sclerotialis]